MACDIHYWKVRAVSNGLTQHVGLLGNLAGMTTLPSALVGIVEARRHSRDDGSTRGILWASTNSELADEYASG